MGKTPTSANPYNYEDLLRQMETRKIPVHSFYIGQPSYPGAYFEAVSRRTGGRCENYNYQASNAAELLTNFIVEQVLMRIGGDKMGQKLVQTFKKMMMK